MVQNAHPDRCHCNSGPGRLHHLCLLQLRAIPSSKYQDLQVNRWLAGPAYQEFQLSFSKADGYEVAAQLSLNVSDVYPQGEAQR